MSTPTVAPDEFMQGTTVKWTLYCADYAPGTWTLTYYFFNATDHRSIAATNNGDGSFLVTISAVASAAFTAARYDYVAHATNGSEVYELDRGSLEVIASATAVNYDGRSHVKKVLDAIEALLEGKASRSDVAQYSIGTGTGSRSLAYLSPTELIQWRDKYRAEYQRELRAERLAKGLGSKNKVRVRFVTGA